MKLILRKREYADLFLASLQHNTLIGLYWRVAVICCCLLRRHLRDKRLIVSGCYLLAGVSAVVCLLSGCGQLFFLSRLHFSSFPSIDHYRETGAPNQDEQLISGPQMIKKIG